jgi:hypothetical protein
MSSMLLLPRIGRPSEHPTGADADERGTRGDHHGDT